jgi:hypothetical protein
VIKQFSNSLHQEQTNSIYRTWEILFSLLYTKRRRVQFAKQRQNFCVVQTLANSAGGTLSPLSSHPSCSFL